MGLTSSLVLYTAPYTKITNLHDLNVALANNTDYYVLSVIHSAIHTVQLVASSYAIQSVLLSVFKNTYVDYVSDVESLVKSLFNNQSNVVAASGIAKYVRISNTLAFISLQYSEFSDLITFSANISYGYVVIMKRYSPPREIVRSLIITAYM